MSYEDWSYGKDGASLISRLLFEEATDINFYVGKAINPAHQNPDLSINFNIKMNLVQELSEALKKMGKRIKVSYFYGAITRQPDTGVQHLKYRE